MVHRASLSLLVPKESRSGSAAFEHVFWAAELCLRVNRNGENHRRCSATEDSSDTPCVTPPGHSSDPTAWHPTAYDAGGTPQPGWFCLRTWTHWEVRRRTVGKMEAWTVHAGARLAFVGVFYVVLFNRCLPTFGPLDSKVTEE